MREPTADSQPRVGALLKRQTSECASISLPRGSMRSVSALPTTAQRPADAIGTSNLPRNACPGIGGLQLGSVGMAEATAEPEVAIFTAGSTPALRCWL